MQSATSYQHQVHQVLGTKNVVQGSPEDIMFSMDITFLMVFFVSCFFFDLTSLLNTDNKLFAITK